jgi:hypothetical protein
MRAAVPVRRCDHRRTPRPPGHLRLQPHRHRTQPPLTTRHTPVLEPVLLPSRMSFSMYSWTIVRTVRSSIQPSRSAFVAVAAKMSSGTCSRSRKTRLSGSWPSSLVRVVLPAAGGPMTEITLHNMGSPNFFKLTCGFGIRIPAYPGGPTQRGVPESHEPVSQFNTSLSTSSALPSTRRSTNAAPGRISGDAR